MSTNNCKGAPIVGIPKDKKDDLKLKIVEGGLSKTGLSLSLCHRLSV